MIMACQKNDSSQLSTYFFPSLSLTLSLLFSLSFLTLSSLCLSFSQPLTPQLTQLILGPYHCTN